MKWFTIKYNQYFVSYQEIILTLMIYIGYPHNNTELIKNIRGAFEFPAFPKSNPHTSPIDGNQLERRLVSALSKSTMSLCRWLRASSRGVLSFLSNGSRLMVFWNLNDIVMKL